MSGTVYVLTPDTNAAVGGVKVHYQLVDALNAAGRPAAVVHERSGFRCTWFANETPTVAAGTVKFRGDDVVVVPEEWVHHVPELPLEVTKVIFNQNTYTTFLWGQPWSLMRTLYARDDVKRVVVVSSDNLEYIRYVFPSVGAARIRPGIDPAIFHPGDAKTRTIAYMPRRRSQEADEVLSIVGARGALDTWEVVPITNRSEADAAAIMRRASVFLAFSHREGFGLPPAEALACGCVVVGFHGFGGRDIGEHPLWVPEGDVIAFARTLEHILSSWDGDSERWSQLAHDGAAHVAEHFGPDRFDASVADAFEGLESHGDARVVGELPTSFWHEGPRWPGVLRYLRSAARVAVKGGT